MVEKIRKIEIREEERKTKVFIATCPFCKKEIESQFSEKQALSNATVHMLNCEEGKR